MPEEELARDLREPTAESPALQEVLLDIYRHAPMVAQICGTSG